MNIVLFDETQKINDDVFQLTEQQSKHIHSVIKMQEGARIRIGLLNGNMGYGTYLGKEAASIEVVSLDQAPPKALPLTLVLALPRPNMLKRTLLNITSMGVKNIVIVNSAKVEKSYWQSPVLEYSNLQGILREGLEQAKDTLLPSLQLIPRFKPFVEDILPRMLSGKRGLLAHPYNASVCPVALTEPSILAIGPEGGGTNLRWKNGVKLVLNKCI
ncbi:RsmE family RNA methyltransferase [Marinomonas sp. 15G1-11]|uniref:Ribosomal RNA small subunit methyltransferase E n=1 Tax=Marinomonas phaeophyticola TaxID=3004091 RepID=A0ABT4JV70_9GAMM|nr:RsmE family RNA methyltransferase [Marinomonas sp. 15G1-11]MCZ2722111.1 RsmE family RNA methyltransferase [Marinomonas sp. 15G1-11]